ncbi:tyrosine-type recombinase/integrase [Desulfovibrio litoralis]|uniref:Integrase n=1 Tax=Desulfovibrio litoralis DSM 11393 TaxID=1121455 RepID=A0A1M7RS46_9BACT|nr:integrase arm-type DNA-binding domain-containing protein [Desulfovibrio litoralis]SHN48946.1 Integrase [Desulfovibrio litoralis DSM 11393]
MKLTDTLLRSLKAPDKVQKLTDGGGLYLQVEPKGGKLWRLAYRFGGKQKTLAFGAYPAVSLKEARKRRDEAKELIANGVDPSEQKKVEKAKTVAKQKELVSTFESVGREWFNKRTVHLTEEYRKQILSRIENQIFPYIGTKLISNLEPADILFAVSHAEKKGAIETAHRLVQISGQICRYARLAGYCKYDITAGLTEALPKVQTKHLASITDPKELSLLLQSIENYQGDLSVVYALKILPYVFVRSNELRGARWAEIDFKTAEWVIPAGRMKMKTVHVVPLASQVLKLLEELQPHSGHSEFLFISPASASNPISDMGLLNALRRMGYQRGEMTIHGFRSTASTLLNGMGYNSDWIERQLAHCERNAVRKAYNHAEYLPERKKMMQKWADYLDGLREKTTQS